MAGSQSTGSEATYSTGARHFHWWTVALFALQVALGLFMVRYAAATNFAEPSGRMYDIHKLLGLAILVLAVARLIYRLSRGAPSDEPTLELWQKLSSHLTHWAIYALLLIVPLLGWLAVSYYGPFAPFGIALPSLAGQNDAMATRTFFLHMLGAYALILLVAMHIGAALFHYFIRKDGVLARMLPWAGRRG
jgi:cytochrome b561